VKLLVTTDFHLGLTRSANFTADSNQAREAESRKTLSSILSTPHDEAICVGDFFDKFSNSEGLLLESLHYAEHFKFILAGNHDLSNRHSAKSSLEVVNRVLGNVVFEPLVSSGEEVAYHFVPHCLTQDLFEHELERLAPEEGKRNLLFLHCNYNIPFEQDYASLNLSAQRAEQLLEHFDHIFVGHVHTPSDHFEDRLHIVGSHFPTAFDNLTDKRHLVYYSATNQVTSICHWKADQMAYVGPSDTAPDGRQFYDFTTPCDPKLAVKLFKQGAFGIRLPCAVPQRQALKVDAFERLPDAIARELREKDTDLFHLWTELSHADLD
jgi:DNA repair exonuclease SbcCD nuclease subunit